MNQKFAYVTHLGEQVTFNGIPVIYQNMVGMRGMGGKKNKSENPPLDFKPSDEVSEEFDLYKWAAFLSGQQTKTIADSKTDPIPNPIKKYDFLNELENYTPQPKKLNLSFIPSLKKSK